MMHNNNRYNCRVYILNRQIILIRPKVYPAEDTTSYHERRFFASWDIKTNGAKVTLLTNELSRNSSNLLLYEWSTQQKGVHQKIGNYKLDLGDNGPVYMEEHILSDVLRNVTNQIAVPFGAAVIATEEATISADVFGELQGKIRLL